VVQIVEHQHERSLGAGESHQALGDRVGVVSVAVAGSSRRLGQVRAERQQSRGQAPEQPVTVHALGGTVDGLTNGQKEVPAPFCAPPGQDQSALFGERHDDFGQQARLADPRVTGDDGHRGAPRERVAPRPGETLPFMGPTEEGIAAQPLRPPHVGCPFGDHLVFTLRPATAWRHGIGHRGDHRRGPRRSGHDIKIGVLGHDGHLDPA